MEKTIIHSDLNNFYASVECRDKPHLKDKPVAVVGDEELRHGIILAKNYIAKAYDIKTGEPIVSALKKCKNLVLVKADLKKYFEVSVEVKKIYTDFTDYIEPFGIDEAWLDVTGSLKMFKGAENIAEGIRARVKKDLGLTVSIGVSYNKIFAKLGSDMKKPDAITYITKENYKEVVWRLPVKELLYVGKATNEKLNKYGINTIGQLANTDSGFLNSRLGKWGIIIKSFANGEDFGNVEKQNFIPRIKSVGNSNTAARDLKNIEEVKSLIYVLSESVATRLKCSGFYCGGIQIYIRDNRLISYTASHIERIYYNDSKTIAENAINLFKKTYSWEQAVRSIGVSAINLSDKQDNQLNFYDTVSPFQKYEKADIVIDRLRSKYGFKTLRRGIVLEDYEMSHINPISDNIVYPYSYFKGKD